MPTPQSSDEGGRSSLLQKTYTHRINVTKYISYNTMSYEAKEKNIHIIPDNKFTEDFVENAEKLQPNRNLYLSVARGESPRFPSDEVVYFEDYEKIKTNSEIEKARRIYIHGLWDWRTKVLEGISSQQSITWVMYGYDVYKRLPFERLYEKRTLPVHYWEKDEMELADWARLAGICRPQISKYINQRRLLSKFDSAAFWLPSDLRKIVRFYRLDIDFIEFCYSTVSVESVKYDEQVNEINRVLLGNSADSTNNHIDALEKVKKSNYKGDIFCPLSYAGSEGYIEKVIKHGKKMFGSEFHPILEYLDKKEYYKLLDKMDAAVFYHRRQQAGNNVRYFLSRGKPVFLNPKSPLITYFRKLNIQIVQKMKYFGNIVDIKQKDVQESVKVMEQWCSEKRTQERYERLLTH